MFGGLAEALVEVSAGVELGPGFELLDFLWRSGMSSDSANCRTLFRVVPEGILFSQMSFYN